MVVTRQKVRRGRAKRSDKIMYPIFEQAARLTDDPYWQEVALDAAYGVFPTNFFYQEGVLYYKKASKVVSRITIPGNPTDALNIFIECCRRLGDMCSARDKAEEQIRYSQMTKDDQPTWSKVSKGKLKETLINDYVNKLAYYYQLSTNDKIELAALLHYGFLMGYLKPASVVLKDSSIDAIIGLVYSEETKAFSLDPSLKPKKVKKPAKVINELADNNFTFFPVKRISYFDVWRAYESTCHRRRDNKNKYQRKVEKIAESCSHDLSGT